jgi:DNA-directed RNA polymerase specialized sigma24 family protein
MPFQTTRWSLVLAAGGTDEAAERALSSLCEAYWYPLYGYVRRHGHSPEDAQDLTQAFLADLLERRDLARVRRERGRFRAFLLGSMKHFLLNDAAARRALKRGGGRPLLPLEFDAAERTYSREPADAQTPETIFDRRWALVVLERVFGRLRREAEAAGKVAEFDRLKPWLTGETPPGGYAALESAIGLSDGAARVAVHRLRRRFQRRLRQEIAETVEGDEAVDDEINYLVRVLRAH